MHNLHPLISIAVKTIPLINNPIYLKSLGILTYVRECRTISLRLPRQCGKSSYIKEYSNPLTDIVLYPGPTAIKDNGGTSSYFQNINDIDNLEYTQYYIIWLDEFKSGVFEDKKYSSKINSLIRTGNEIVIHLTSR